MLCYTLNPFQMPSRKRDKTDDRASDARKRDREQRETDFVARREEIPVGPGALVTVEEMAPVSEGQLIVLDNLLQQARSHIENSVNAALSTLLSRVNTELVPYTSAIEEQSESMNNLSAALTTQSRSTETSLQNMQGALQSQGHSIQQALSYLDDYLRGAVQDVRDEMHLNEQALRSSLSLVQTLGAQRNEFLDALDVHRNNITQSFAEGVEVLRDFVRQQLTAAEEEISDSAQQRAATREAHEEHRHQSLINSINTMRSELSARIENLETLIVAHRYNPELQREIKREEMQTMELSRKIENLTSASESDPFSF